MEDPARGGKIGRERVTLDDLKEQPIIREALKICDTDPARVFLPIGKTNQVESLMINNDIPNKPYIFLSKQSGRVDWNIDAALFTYRFSTDSYVFYMNVLSELIPDSLIPQLEGSNLSQIIDVPGAAECTIVSYLEVGERIALIVED